MNKAKKRGLVTRACLAGMAVGLALGAPGHSSKAKAADQLQVRVAKRVEITSSRRYCWFPGIHRFGSGEILATIRMSPDEWHPEGAFSAYSISKDGGLTWSRRYTMGPGANPDGAFTREPRPDGSIWQLWHWQEPHPPGQAKQFYTTLTKYLRAGREVTQIRDTIVRFDEPMNVEPVHVQNTPVKSDHSKLDGVPDVWMFGSIIEALNGDLLATMTGRLQRDERYYRVLLLRSADDGKTWTQYATVAAVERDQKPWPRMGPAGPSETALVRLADDSLYAIFRTSGRGELAHAWSSDDGKTWTWPEPVGFQGVAPRARLLESGMLALTTGRPGPVTLRFSLDGSGKTWSHATELFGGMSTRYTDFIEVEPGKLLVIHDSVPYGWDPIPDSDKTARNIVFGVFVEFEKQ